MGGDGRRRDGDGHGKAMGSMPKGARFNDNDDHFPEIVRRVEPARPPSAHQSQTFNQVLAKTHRNLK